MTDEEPINKIFNQFKNRNVTVELKDDNQSQGKVLAIDNYLNIVLENEKGLETLKGGNILFLSIDE